MGSIKAYAAIALLLIAFPVFAAEQRFWKTGRLVSVEAITSPDKDERRYECVVSDGNFSYTVEYERPIKAPAHRPVRFVIERIQDNLILLDADGKERQAHIEKRERVLFDWPDRFQNSK
jgi:hypothetical protein